MIKFETNKHCQALYCWLDRDEILVVLPFFTTKQNKIYPTENLLLSDWFVPKNNMKKAINMF